jgi:hypothetical protein
MMKKMLIRAAAALMVTTLLLSPSDANKKKQEKWSGEKVTQNGRVDWRKGTIYATGQGAIDRHNPNQAKAYLRAREYAKVDALANLLMAIDHIRIDARTIGRDFEAETTIRAEIQGIVRGAEIVDERKINVGGDTIVEVTVGTPMYGERSVASVFIPEVARREEEVAGSDPEVLQPMVKVKVDVVKRNKLPVPRAPRADTGITSVIIDARGFGVERGMCPKIRRPDGSEVWGTVKADPDFVIEHGIAVYANSLGQAQNDARAGGNPLIIRACGKAGNRFNTDVVISAQDAERLLEADDENGFLGKYRVIFVLDPGK